MGKNVRKSTSQNLKSKTDWKVIYSNLLEQFGTKRFHTVLTILIISAVTFLIYSNVFDNSLHFDDDLWYKNKFIIYLNLADIFGFAKFRFITFLSFAINYFLFKDDFQWYYLVNILIHLFNGVLVWFIVRQIFETPAIKDFPISKYKYVLALLCALIFICHPIQTQAVSYIYQRLASLAGFFYLLTVALFFKSRLAEKKKFLFYLLTFISAVFAFFTKEHTFTLPVIIILSELVFFNKKFKIKLSYILFAFITIGIAFALFYFLFGFERAFGKMTRYDGTEITSYIYLINQFPAYLTYFRLLVLPIDQNLDYVPPIYTNYDEPIIIIGFCVVLVLLVFGLFNINRNKFVSYGILWFFITISIEASFIPILDIMNEHRLYLPMFGFLCVLLGVIQYLQNKNKEKVAILILLIAVPILGVLTFQRNKVWDNEATLWTDVIQKAPNNGRAYIKLANYYQKNKDFDNALRNFDKAEEIVPNFYLVYQNRGVLLYENEFYEPALEDFRQAVSKAPKYAENYKHLGMTFYALKMYDSSAYYYSKYIEMKPQNPQPYYDRALCYLNLNQLDKAISDLNKSLKIDPAFSLSYIKLAEIYFLKKDYPKSILNYTKFLNNNPNNYKVYLGRAVAYFNNRDTISAINDINKAISLNKKYSEAYRHLGLIYELKNQIERAKELYDITISLNPQDFEALYFRARILYKKRDYIGAKEDLVKALKVNPYFIPAKALLKKIK